jgi:hypothetical protein
MNGTKNVIEGLRIGDNNLLTIDWCHDIIHSSMRNKYLQNVILTNTKYIIFVVNITQGA